jgi:sensor domain CHASE-containing protein
MTPAAAAELLDVLSRVGVVGVTVLVIVGFLTGRIVTKSHLEEVRKERDDAQAAHAEVLKRIDEDLRRIEDRVRGS